MSDNVFEAMLEMAGEPFIIIRDEQTVGESLSFKKGIPGTEVQFLVFRPSTDVREGDICRQPKTGVDYLIGYTDIENSSDGLPFQLRAFYGDKATELKEYYAKLAAENQAFQCEPDYDVVEESLVPMASHRPAFNEEEMELASLWLSLGEALKQNSLSRGALAPYAEMIHSEEWIAAAVAGSLMQWLLNK